MAPIRCNAPSCILPPTLIGHVRGRLKDGRVGPVVHERPLLACGVHKEEIARQAITEGEKAIRALCTRMGKPYTVDSWFAEWFPLSKVGIA